MKKLFLVLSLVCFGLTLNKSAFAVNEDSVEQDIQNISLVAQCVFDEHGNISEIVSVTVLDFEKIEQIRDMMIENGVEPVSLEQGLKLMVAGTLDMTRGLCYVAYVGGKYIVPKVIEFSKSTLTVLKQTYDEYKSGQSVDDQVITTA